MDEDRKSMFVKLGDRYDVTTIVACLSSKGTTTIITTEGHFEYGRNLAMVKAKLEPWSFDEVGRHGIVNPAHIKKVVTNRTKMTLLLTGSIEVQVSQSAQHRFK